MNEYQKRQLEVIAKLENQIRVGAKNFSVVTPVSDFESDPRICLTSVHFPSASFLREVQNVVEPLKDLSPEHYYYGPKSIHITIKNIRTISDPPHFNERDIEKVREVFSRVVPKHHKFNAYYFKLMLFQNNLTLVGTTDEEYGKIILGLDDELNRVGIGDDKKYVDSKVFFSNITLVRFVKPINDEFKEKVEAVSSSIKMKPYEIGPVSLITANAVCKKLEVIETWRL